MKLRRLVPILLVSLALAVAFPIRTDTLGNGLVLLSSEDHHVPLVQLRLGIRAGSSADPAGQEGLANLVATLLTRGTATRSATRLNQEIEFVGGELGAWVDYDHIVINIKVLARDLELATDLLTDIVLHPAFGDSEIARAKQEITGGIKRELDDPWSVMDKAFEHDLFGNHPYGHPVSGYDSVVARLTRAEIKDFYNTWFVPNNSYLAVVGDIRVDSLKQLFAERVKGWTVKPVPEIKVPDLAPITGRRARVINRPEMNQAYIILGHYGIAENTPDVFACRLMNFVLGGSVFISKIGTAVREERGLAYDARSGFDRRLLGGTFTATTQTRTDSAQTALNLILKQMVDIRDKGVTADELKKTKDFFMGNFPLQYESSADKVGALDRIALFDLGLDYLERYAVNVKGVTEAEILKAARDHVFPDKYVLVVVGNLTEKDLTIPGIEWQK